MIALPLILLGLAWLQELLDQLLFAGRWTLAMGPGTPWWTLFTAPFSHGGLGHLVANSLVFLPLSYLVLARGTGAYLTVWISVILLEIPIWLVWCGPRSVRSGLWAWGFVLIGFWNTSLAIFLTVAGCFGSACRVCCPGPLQLA